MIFDAYKEHPDSQINKALFWEYDMSRFDWVKLRRLVVQRVIERGDWEDFWALLNMYGYEGVKDALRNEINYLSDRDIAFASHAFGIDKTEMRCYTRKQSRKELLNF